VVAFGLNLTLASVMVNVMSGYAASTEDVGADDAADEELRVFGRQRRAAVVLQAAATVLGLILPEVAVVFYLAISLLLVIDPIWRAARHRRRSRRAAL
jgi:hypothetical protein